MPRTESFARIPLSLSPPSGKPSKVKFSKRILTRSLVAALCTLLVVQLSTRSARAQVKIESVHIFQAAETSGGEVSYYLEINGQKFSTLKDLRAFIAPQQGLKEQPQVVSSSDSQIVAKFIGPAGYFPTAVGVAGTGVVEVWDVPRNVDPNQVRIDDVEVLALDRMLGTGRIKISGANFGKEPNNLRVSIVPHDPTYPVFAPVPPRFVSSKKDKKNNEEPAYYACNQPTGQPGTPELAQPPPVIRPESTENMVIVEFSFPCYQGYSVPFRIARVVLTIVDSAGKPFSSASYEMTPPRDKNLIYHYSILGTAQAISRFGRGISENFYAVQLSIVNNGSKKVQIPLASIQAEVEWIVGTVEDKNYLEGPATVTPVPLPGAVSFFSKDRKSSGRRALLFNSLQGLTTVGSAIETFFGHGFTQGIAIAGGGFRQGLGQIFQDLSDEQLASLTSQSYESIETVSGNGGSIEKVIFIQRGEEVIESYRRNQKFRRLISNIDGFEITGYEVSETPAKGATPATP